MKNRQFILGCLCLLTTCSLVHQSVACGPGRSGGRRRNARKMTPLVFKQYSPNLNENTMIASGPPEGRITRDDPRYRDLVPNYNPDILFRDVEGTGASRLMTQRLKEKLDILSISVMNQWPGVRLRVLKGWDEHNLHAFQSLHYEGRAVDLATSDRDRSKNGMLARLAVQAGFDWVYYESRYHVHASVKSEKAHSLRPEGCFLGTSLVQTRKRGVITMDRLEIGDEVLARNSQNKLEYSKVLMFLDLDAYASKLYYYIKTETDAVIALTESHLIYVADGPNDEPDVDFAAYVKEGMYVLVPEQTVINRTGDDLVTNDIEQVVNAAEHKPIRSDGAFRPVRVVEVKSEMRVSAYAPLTDAGTMIVDGVVVSCYAHMINQSLAHLGFLPVRLFDKLYTAYFTFRDNYLGKSERLDDLSKSEEISSSKQPIKVDRRIVNSKLLHLFDKNYVSNNSSDPTNSKLQYELHKSIRPQQGVHWYAYLLFYLSKLIVPADYIYH